MISAFRVQPAPAAEPQRDAILMPIVEGPARDMRDAAQAADCGFTRLVVRTGMLLGPVAQFNETAGDRVKCIQRWAVSRPRLGWSPIVYSVDMNAAWPQADAFPAGALTRRAAGDTRLALTFDEAGRVATCGVTKGSGDPALDSRSCEIVHGAAVRDLLTPRPAANEGAAPIMRWRMPSKGPAPDHGGTIPIAPNFWFRTADMVSNEKLARGGARRIAFDIGTDGRIAGCSGQGDPAGAAGGLTRNLCAVVRARAGFIVPTKPLSSRPVTLKGGMEVVLGSR